MTSSNIEALLKAANSSPDNDSSTNTAQRTFFNEYDGKAFFDHTKNKLFQIAEWRNNSSATDYDLFDGSGEQVVDGRLGAGRFIRIKLYGGGKYDWVRVMSVVDGPAELIITVKPSHDPTQTPIDTATVSHFFGPEATNNFCLQRNDKTVAFYVIGLNEKTNTDFAGGLIESARNTAVANLGYYSGLQKAVWKEFCVRMVSSRDEESE